MAERLSGDGPARWAAAPRDEVASLLDARPRDLIEAKLRDYDARSAQVRQPLVETFAEAPGVVRPHVHMLHGGANVKRAYDEMLGSAHAELVMFTRPPYATRRGYVNPRVREMLRRGVTARVLYQEGDEGDPAFIAYREQGVEARVVPELASS